MYYCYEHLKLVDIFESVIYLSLQYPCLFNSESSSHEHGCSMTHAPVTTAQWSKPTQTKF